MKSLEDLRLVPVWVNPNHTVESALILMKGHGLRAIAVMERGVLLGVLTMDLSAASASDALVGDVMRKKPTVLEPDEAVVKVAQQFVEEDADVGVVMDETRFYGVVTSNMLLRELRRSWDTLTGLGFSDRLREWGIEQLTAGREITILFIDLDSFGEYNKKYGHPVGDRVLKRVAKLLKDSVGESDILVRYGGDEFAIGTLRARAEAEDLAASIREGSSSLFIEGDYHPVAFTIGIAGGRRSVTRPDIHVAATLDWLITAASRDAMAKKPRKDKAPPA
ncbi:MAG: GGDEF domain-containing protein [Chthonomonas sp.]|nr:GGDEF domain-containing protein [Chthonomonas sp.]